MSTDETVKQYVCPPGSENVAWKGIQDLWQGNLLCDVTINAEGRSFEAHRCYLASCSPYFLSMFTGDFRERTEKEVNIQGVSAKGLEDVISYMYTGKIMLDHESLKDILDVACHLQVTDIQKLCEDYLKKNLSIKNCLQFLNLTELYSLKETGTFVFDYLRDNFAKVAENADFDSITLELLCELLSSDSLNIESELTVFRSAIKWLQHAPERLLHTTQVLGLVRFGLMSSKEMKEVYEPGGLMMQEPCQKLLKAALDYHMNEFEQPLLARQLASPRNTVDSLIVYGGLGKDTLLAAQIGPTDLMNYSHFGELKEVRADAQVVELNNFLFVVGGNKIEPYKAVNSAYRYNPRDGKWLQLSCMASARSKFVLVYLSGCLYAIGGYTNDEIPLSCVEKYDIKDNVWSGVANLNHDIIGHAGCECGGQLFISGGSSDYRQLQSYSPGRNIWQTRTPMNYGRVDHNMVSYGNNVYVLGGAADLANCPDEAFQTEMYNLDTCQWTVLSRALHPHREAGCAQHGSDVYILGGNNRHDFLTEIQRYNIDADEWTVVSRDYPIHIFDQLVAAAYLKLPRQVFQSDVSSP